MAQHPLAGKPATDGDLLDVPRLMTAYFTRRPDASVPAQRVAFGTSGHRGSAFDCAFNEDHVLAITQAICDLPAARRGSTGRCSSASTPTRCRNRRSPPPSRCWPPTGGGEDRRAQGLHTDPGHLPRHPHPQPRAGHRTGRADGIVVTPSHNPPHDGGFKYNPPSGGPGRHRGHRLDRGSGQRAAGGRPRRRPAHPLRAGAPRRHHPGPRLPRLLRRRPGRRGGLRAAIRAAGVALGVDPLGGAGVALLGGHRRSATSWSSTVVSDEVDPTFRFMTLDWDGKIRMDCSSPYAMQRPDRAQGPVRRRLRQRHRPRPPRHRHAGRRAAGPQPLPRRRDLLPASATGPTGRPRPGSARRWSARSLIDRRGRRLDRPLVEVPVGFKWFVGGLLDGQPRVRRRGECRRLVLRRDGTVWTTDKDGIVLGLLAAEMTAVTGRDPGELTDAHWPTLRRPRLRAHRRPRHARAEGSAQAASRPSRSRSDRAGRRADHRHC